MRIVDIKGTDWNVNLPDGTTAPINRHDFSYEEDGKRQTFDYAYITIHGTPGENGILQGYFDLLNIPYSTSGVLVEAMTFDKFVLINYLRSFGVRVAESLLIRRGQEDKISENDVMERIGMPCFVKPATNGSSFGVSKVKNIDQLAPALRNAMMESDTVMVEQFLDGTEITVGCYKTRTKSVVFPVTEVVTKNEFFDYDAKYNGQVDEITPARIPDELAKRAQDLTSAIYDILHCNGIIRVDYIITRGSDGHDKLNMLRHAKFFGSYEGLLKQMNKHKAIIAPKFKAVLDKLDAEIKPLGIGEYTKPNGGYFISFNTIDGCAKKVVSLCKEAGVVMTGAGATYPYKKDPKDSNIRIAPTLPPVSELEQAMKIFVCAVKLASAEKMLENM